MSLISCKNLSLGYDGREIIKDLSFDVSEGDYLCMVGENGSGKTTLMKTLLGLNPLISGKIEFSGGLKGSQIGYLPQQTPVQRDFPASVTEIVLSGFEGGMGLRPFYSAAQKETALGNIKKMGIEHLKNRCYRELSGGQQQRVLLARALCATSKLLLLDEPVAVTITFIDHGIPYDPLAKADPDVALPAEERAIGGLGIFMTKKIMDGLSYEYKDGQNILTLTKNL